MVTPLYLVLAALASTVVANPPQDTSVATSRPADCTKVIFDGLTLEFGPTFTKWTTTTTKTNLIDCSGCTKLHRTHIPLGIPPVVRFNTTVTETTPSTTIVVECSPTPTSNTAGLTPHVRREPPKVTTVTNPGYPNPSCTFSTMVHPRIPDQESTKYKSTVTSTKTVPCGPCALVWSTAELKFFAPIRYTKTVTATTPSIKTDLECATATSK